MGGVKGSTGSRDGNRIRQQSLKAYSTRPLPTRPYGQRSFLPIFMA
jgi:hypothetical protein